MGNLGLKNIFLEVETRKKPKSETFEKIFWKKSIVQKKPKGKDPLKSQGLQRYLVLGRHRTDDHLLGKHPPILTTGGVNELLRSGPSEKKHHCHEILPGNSEKKPKFQDLTLACKLKTSQKLATTWIQIQVTTRRVANS